MWKRSWLLLENVGNLSFGLEPDDTLFFLVKIVRTEGCFVGWDRDIRLWMYLETTGLGNGYDRVDSMYIHCRSFPWKLLCRVVQTTKELKIIIPVTYVWGLRRSALSRRFLWFPSETNRPRTLWEFRMGDLIIYEGSNKLYLICQKHQQWGFWFGCFIYICNC